MLEHDLDMIFGLERKLGLLAPGLDGLIVLVVVPFRHGHVGHVRHLQHELAPFDDDLFQLFFLFGEMFLERAEFGHELFAGFGVHGSGHAFTDALLFGAETLHELQSLATAVVERDEVVEAHFDGFLANGVLDEILIFPNKFDIQHIV